MTNDKESPNLSRKEREKLFKQNEIIEAANKLFSQKGYENTTLEEIAEAAEFGKATLYSYFQNKEEIYNAVMTSMLNDYLELHIEISKNSETFIEFIEKITRAIISYCNENRFAFHLMMRAQNHIIRNDSFINSEQLRNQHDQIICIYEEKFNAAVRNNEVKNYNSKSVIYLFTNMLFSYLHIILSQRSENEIDIEIESNLVLSIFLNGILENQ